MPSGNVDQPVGRHDAHLGIGALDALIDDAVADLDRGHAGTNGFDDPRPFRPHHRRQRQLVEAAPLVRVDEVDADRRLPHQRLAGARRRHRHLDPFHDLGAAGAFDADDVGHGFALFVFSQTGSGAARARRHSYAFGEASGNRRRFNDPANSALRIISGRIAARPAFSPALCATNPTSGGPTIEPM